MSVFDRIGMLRALFPFGGRRTAGRVAVCWAEAAEREPRLVEHLIVLGGVLALAPRRYVAGVQQPDAIDPMRMARDAGRRELALELLALMNVTAPELRALMEDDRHDRDDHR
jgi:hypothetical protein